MRPSARERSTQTNIQPAHIMPYVEQKYFYKLRAVAPLCLSHNQYIDSKVTK